MESWILATATAAAIWSLIGIVAKRLMDHESSLIYTFLYSFLALIFYTPVFLYYLPEANIKINQLLIGAVTVSGLANILGFTAYNYSIKFGDLSTIIPFTKLNPIFTAILGFFVLGEQITLYTGTGILLVTVGSYLILEDNDRHWLAPFKRFWKARAPKVAALSALIFSFAAIADRFATQQITPEIYTFIIFTFMTTGFTTYLSRERETPFKDVKKQFKENKKLYLLTGLGAATASYLIFYSFSKAAASKVIPILQLQVLASVIAGVLIFEEDNLKQKLIGATVMIAGVTLVVI